MAMPGRTYASTIGGYRYAHNGQEKDGEIFDGALSAEFWEYDSRLGRRWDTDPIACAWQTPYACFDNSPIVLADVPGLQPDPPFMVQSTKTLLKPLSAAELRGLAQMQMGYASTTEQLIVNDVLKTGASSLGKAISWTIGLLLLDGGIGKGDQPLYFSHHIQITTSPEKLSQFVLDGVRRRVEAGHGSPNDHKIYNAVLGPKSQAPFKTQSHHVIPIAAFTDISNPLFALASKDPGFNKMMDSESNRIPLGADVHGNHPAYTDRINKEAEAIFYSDRPTTPAEAMTLIHNYMGRMKGEIRNEINKNPGVRLNQIYKNKGYGAGKNNNGGGSVKKSGGSKGGVVKKKRSNSSHGKKRYPHATKKKK